MDIRQFYEELAVAPDLSSVTVSTKSKGDICLTQITTKHFQLVNEFISEPINFEIAIVAVSITFEGQRLVDKFGFKPTMDIVGNMPRSDVSALAAESLKLNKLGSDDLEESEKNSIAEQSTTD